jgi:hypothetical protein
MKQKLYRIEYRKNGSFIYSSYLRMALEDVDYNAARDAAKMDWSYSITEASE